MRTISQTALRKTLSTALDSLTTADDPILITRDNGQPAAVLMSLETFASHEETQYLLKSPANAARLLDSISELEAPHRSRR